MSNILFCCRIFRTETDANIYRRTYYIQVSTYISVLCYTHRLIDLLKTCRIIVAPVNISPSDLTPNSREILVHDVGIDFFEFFCFRVHGTFLNVLYSVCTLFHLSRLPRRRVRHAKREKLRFPQKA